MQPMEADTFLFAVAQVLEQQGGVAVLLSALADGGGRRAQGHGSCAAAHVSSPFCPTAKVFNRIMVC